MRKHGNKDFDIHEYMGEATVEILLGMGSILYKNTILFQLYRWL